jgi:hypothetical protein
MAKKADAIIRDAGPREPSRVTVRVARKGLRQGTLWLD